MAAQQKDPDQLTGLQAFRALDEARLDAGLKIQPQEREDQPADEAWPVSHLTINREEGLLEVKIQGSEEQMTFLARWNLFVLFIKYRNQLHESEGLEVVRLQPGRETLTLFLELPTRFRKVFHREFFRVYLDSRLEILCRVQLPQGVMTSRLLDLSAAGCRAGTAFQAALQLVRPLPELLQVTLEFPNGESITTPATLTYLQPNEDFSQALVGWHFVHVDNEAEKKFFRFTLEAERELARLRHPNKGNLHKSQLFQRPKQEVAAAKSRMRKTYSMVPKAYQSQVLQVADLLAAQVLLLAAGNKLNSSRMGQLAKLFIKLLDENHSALLLTLEQPQRKIHPVLLHSLRVAARCFPLVFKIGLTRSYELPTMVSLLMHDLGKFFLGHQPCFNPLKEPHEVLRNLKLHQIQLLRAASELHWIPRDLGESLMVNANERLDGSGYPRRLTAKRLNPLSRLMGVVKVLDCLVHGYRDPARSWQEAYQWVYKKDQWFDRNALNTFVTYYGLRPVGSHLHFQSGGLACVSQVSDRGQLEAVILIKKMDSQGNILEGETVSGAELQALGNPVKELARHEFNPLASSNI